MMQIICCIFCLFMLPSAVSPRTTCTLQDVLHDLWRSPNCVNSISLHDLWHVLPDVIKNARCDVQQGHIAFRLHALGNAIKDLFLDVQHRHKGIQLPCALGRALLGMSAHGCSPSRFLVLLLIFSSSFLTSTAFRARTVTISGTSSKSGQHCGGHGTSSEPNAELQTATDRGSLRDPTPTWNKKAATGRT